MLEKCDRNAGWVKMIDGHKSHTGCRSEAAFDPFIHLADTYLATPACQVPQEALRLSRPDRYTTYSYEA